MPLDRRSFLVRTGAVGAATLATGPFAGLAARSASAAEGTADAGLRHDPSYGPLGPVPDLRDGVVRLHLPEGFRYRSFDPVGSTLTDGTPVPPNHDGMAAFPGPRGNVVLVRNHEINGPGTAFGDVSRAYDPAARGGTTTVVVSRRGHVRRSWVSCNGTQMNCSGGPMPWGSWITCEETVNGPDVGPDFTGVSNAALRQKHGYIYEVPAYGRRSRGPVRAAGRFAHESVAFSPNDGWLYMTEDNFGFPSGFYRYKPPVSPFRAGRLLDGGRLQMLAVRGEPNADLSVGQPMGVRYRVSWIDIDEPDPDFAPGTTNNDAISAVGAQGRAEGAALFSRLEGMIYDRGVAYFTSTQGGRPDPTAPLPSGFGDGRGQVWGYDTRRGILRLVYESPSLEVLDLPDNVTASPRGTLVLCEDGGGVNYLRGLTQDGRIFDFALNAIPGQESDEFAGSTFAPGGGTLYVNIQSRNAMSFAIWGPWWRGGF